MTKTDDFLSDLGAQLRTARPRRRAPAALALVPVVLIAILVLALAPRHHAARQPTAAGPVIPVAIRNHSGKPELAPRLPRGFAYKAVEQRPRSAGASFVAPINGGTMAQARALARTLDLPLRGPRKFPGNSAVRVEISAGPDLVPRNAPIAILNGTTRSGIAGDLARQLRRFGYRVPTVSNAPDQAQRLTTVTATAPRFEAAARALRQRLHAIAAPERLAANRPLAPDAGVFVVLGGDQYEPGSDVPGARALVRTLHAAGCTAAPDGHGPLYRCEIADHAYTVRLRANGCYDAVPIHAGRERVGCGLRP